MSEKDPQLADQMKQMLGGMGLGGDAKPKEPEVKVPPLETCRNCAEPCSKPLRCSVCKAATYCSAKCQKEDWQFHKRNCKRPAPQPTPDQPQPVEKGTKSEPLRPKASDSEVVNEDVGTWYLHRDWKPQDEKKEFAPEKVETPQESTSSGKKKRSAWNSAGTWEERSMLPWWQEKLVAAIKDISLESFAGTSRMLGVEQVGKATGEAAIVHIRGTPRFFFDLHFEVEIYTKYPRSSRSCKGVVKVTEFSNDLAASGDAFPVEVTMESEGDKPGVVKEFVPKMQDAMRKIVGEYESQAEAPAGGPFPGQLPPAQTSK